MRSFWVLTHKYIGLFLGLLLSVTGVSGSLIVFDRELDELIAPETADFPYAEQLASFDLALANATEAVGNDSVPTRIALGRHGGAPHIVRFPARDGGVGPLEVSIDPGSAQVLAIRGWGEYPVTWLYRLHMSLMGGERGELLVGLMGFAMVFFCLSGLYIWWPRGGGRVWRKALTMTTKKGVFRTNYDLHKTIGVYFLPVFLVLGITGIEIVWHEPFERVVASVLPVDPDNAPQSQSQSQSQELPSVTVDRVAASAQAQYPLARIQRIYFPADTNAVFRVTVSHPEEVWNEYSTTTVNVDQYSGVVISVRDGRNVAAGNIFLDWMFPLHNGDGLGIFGRILVFIAGLLPAILFVSGTYMWWYKRRANLRRVQNECSPALQ
tara:strand:+ start:1854 stop:2993 length:1140 start_codon:yes stop_codon:yes gene_type:complete